MIVWATDFVQPLKAKLINGITTEQAAKAIADQYVLATKKAETIMTKCLLTSPINSTIIYNAILSAFNSKLPLSTSMDAFLAPALSLAWTGAQMSSIYSGFLPGHISFIPLNTVLFPGVLPAGMFMSMSPAMVYPSPDTMINCFANAFKAHLLTVSGLHTAIVPPPPAPPYPLPWVGIN